MDTSFKWKSCVRITVNDCISYWRKTCYSVIRDFVPLLNIIYKTSIAKAEIGSRNEGNIA